MLPAGVGACPTAKPRLRPKLRVACVSPAGRGGGVRNLRGGALQASGGGSLFLRVNDQPKLVVSFGASETSYTDRAHAKRTY